MRLKQQIWIIQVVSDFEKFVGDLLCARELPPTGAKQPQPCQRRRQVHGAFKLTR